MAKLLNQIVLLLVTGLLFSVRESFASYPLKTRFEQLLQLIMLQDTTSETNLQETALAQDIPLEHEPLSSVGPYCSAGRLMTEDGCTAFMITKNHALTARHCVLIKMEGGGASRSKITRPKHELSLCLGRNCDIEGTCLTASRVKTSTRSDYALITYEEDYWCYHSLRYSDTWDGSQIELFGYPNRPWPTSPGDPTSCRYDPLYHSVCSSTSGRWDGDIIRYCDESVNGMSGSPMSVPTESGVYGVHSGKNNGRGQGVLITKRRYCDIASCINYDSRYKDWGASTCSGYHKNCALYY